MALQSFLCTPQDVRNLSELVTTAVRDDARIYQFIVRADSLVRGALRPLYTLDTNLLAAAPWNNKPQAPYARPDQDITANSTSVALVDVTPSASAVTEQWTVTFTSTTAFAVSGSVSGAQGTGSTGTAFTSTNTYVVIPTANWTGTPAATGDKIVFSTYKPDPLIVTLSAMLAAGLTIKHTFEGNEMPDEGADLWKQGMSLLDRLQRPMDDDGLQLGSYSPPDLSPEGVQYYVDYLGRDAGKYADNERTPWNDETLGGAFNYLWGPVWGI